MSFAPVDLFEQIRTYRSCIENEFSVCVVGTYYIYLISSHLVCTNPDRLSVPILYHSPSTEVASVDLIQMIFLQIFPDHKSWVIVVKLRLQPPQKFFAFLFRSFWVFSSLLLLS